MTSIAVEQALIYPVTVALASQLVHESLDPSSLPYLYSRYTRLTLIYATQQSLPPLKPPLTLALSAFNPLLLVAASLDPLHYSFVDPYPFPYY